MANDYEILREQKKLQEQRSRFYNDPWKFNGDRKINQNSCNCKHDPARLSGHCGTCAGWIN